MAHHKNHIADWSNILWLLLHLASYDVLKPKMAHT